MKDNDWFFDKFEQNIEKNAKRTFGFALGIWVASVLGSLAVLGVVIWAIITLVLHFT